jgi:hypothetical protein
MYTVMVTGSRNWTDTVTVHEALEHTLRKHSPLKLVHGAAHGLDTIAGEWGEDQSEVVVVAVPADWKKHGRAAGPIRNDLMLDLYSPDMVLAFPLPGSKGTLHAMEAALKRGVMVVNLGFISISEGEL